MAECVQSPEISLSLKLSLSTGRHSGGHLILELVRPAASGLLPAQALRIQKGFLAHRHAAPPDPVPYLEMVVRPCVECASVVPDHCVLHSWLAL